MAQAHISSSPCFSLLNATTAKCVHPRAPLQLPNSSSLRSGSPLFISVASSKRKLASHAKSVSVRCEQGAKESNGIDVWFGRMAMVGFATVITIEIVTGKGLLENFGFTAPLPTLALAGTAIVGVVATFFIFQSASRE